jgi:TRAP transporter TAXI family solute receptor
MRRLLGLLVAFVSLGVIACERTEATAPVPIQVRLTSGIPGAGFYSLGEALSAAYARALPTVDIVVQRSAGSVHTLEQIQRRQADIGFALADVTYVAFSRGIGNGPSAFDRLRAIAVLELTSLHLVVRSNARINDITDLRGRTIGIGPTGSGTALTSGLVLRAHGIDDDEIDTVELPWNEAARRLVDGTLDAALVNAGYPSQSIAEAAQGGGRLLPLDGPAIDRLRSSYPFFRLTFIPRGTYAGQPTSVRTIGVNNLLVARADLDEQVVYDLSKALFEVFPDIASQRLSLELDLEQAPATPIPLHEGAARYYRERELTR